jgi:signal transduction histidine kinase
MSGRSGARTPLSRKLTRMNLLVSGASLLIACAALGIYDVVTFRTVMLQSLSTQTSVAGINLASAMVFDDAETAARTVEAFVESPDVVAARAYRADGRVLASYARRADAVPPAPVLGPYDREVSVVTARSITVARPVLLDGERVGIVALEGDLTPLYRRAGQYLVLVMVVLAVSLVAAWLVSRAAQKAITRPIADVAAVARRVSDAEDYSVRADPGPASSLEIATFVTAFNDMLAGIQRRDVALADARNRLEDRVRQRTQELQAINQELESFSYSVSHDLRAPLRHVTGFAALLAQHAGGALDDTGRRYLTTMTDAASRMGRLIDDLLAFSRMGRASLAPQDVELARLVGEAKAEIAPELAGRTVEWEIAPLPQVHADPALLRPVLVNLLSNAVKYTATRDVAKIAVGAHEADGECIVHVTDNGVGFQMEYAHKLFGLFQRLHHADEFAGTGVGLANVRRIVQRHGGRTWAEGRPGAGATFYFSLPLAPDERAQGAAGQPAG